MLSPFLRNYLDSLYDGDLPKLRRLAAENSQQFAKAPRRQNVERILDDVQTSNNEKKTLLKQESRRLRGDKVLLVALIVACGYAAPIVFNLFTSRSVDSVLNLNVGVAIVYLILGLCAQKAPKFCGRAIFHLSNVVFITFGLIFLRELFHPSFLFHKQRLTQSALGAALTFVPCVLAVLPLMFEPRRRVAKSNAAPKVGAVCVALAYLHWAALLFFDPSADSLVPLLVPCAACVVLALLSRKVPKLAAWGALIIAFLPFFPAANELFFHRATGASVVFSAIVFLGTLIGLAGKSSSSDAKRR